MFYKTPHGVYSVPQLIECTKTQYCGWKNTPCIWRVYKNTPWYWHTPQGVLKLEQVIPAEECHKKDHHCPSARVYGLPFYDCECMSIALLYLIALEYSCMFLRVMGYSLLNCAKQRMLLNAFKYVLLYQWKYKGDDRTCF